MACKLIGDLEKDYIEDNREELSMTKNSGISKKDIIYLSISICSLLVSIVVLLFGNSLLSKLSIINTQVSDLRTQVGELTKVPTSAPVTEPQHGLNSKDNVTLSVDLGKLNISLADFPEQESQVREWLQNVYSGYPAVATEIQKLMKNQRFKGNSVPLTIINAKLLKLQSRPTNQPIVDPSMIDREQLKQALYLSWKEKNSGSGLADFEDIIE